jgi:hypothetical protein
MFYDYCVENADWMGVSWDKRTVLTTQSRICIIQPTQEKERKTCLQQPISR